MEIQSSFEQKVLSTADNFIKKKRWTDAIQLLNITEMIQESSPNPVVSKLISKILKEAMNLPDIKKTLKVYRELKTNIDESPAILPYDRCLVYFHLSCAYKNLGNIVQAKTYSEKSYSLTLLHKFPCLEKFKINLHHISILSDMGKHEKAASEAYKLIEAFNKISNPSEAVVKLYASSCFQYACEKNMLKDFPEACRYLKVTIDVLSKFEDPGNLLKEAESLYQGIRNEVYCKPKSRPVSASFKQKASNKLMFPKVKKTENSYRVSQGKESVRPLSGSRIMNNEMVKHKQYIEKIMNKPPIYMKKSNEGRLKISSQNDIRILPSRPGSGVSFHSPCSKNFSYFHIENQQSVSLSRIENQSVSLSRIENPISNTEQTIDLNHSTYSNILRSAEKEVISQDNIIDDRERAAIRIQALFRGYKIRKSQSTSKGIEIVYNKWKEIKTFKFLVMVYKLNNQFTLDILDQKSLSLLLRNNISPKDAENIEIFLKNLHLDPENKPAFPEKPQSSNFKHVQRSAKKIGGENLIIDCFSNENNEVLIKAKNFNSQKEFTVKVNKEISSKKDIEDKIFPKLKIKDENLVLSESLDNIPLLVWEGEKSIRNEEYFFSVYAKDDKFLVVAKGKSNLEIAQSEVKPLRCTKSQAKIVWEQAWIEDNRVVIQSGMLENREADEGFGGNVVEQVMEEGGLKIEENSNEIMGIEGGSGLSPRLGDGGVTENIEIKQTEVREEAKAIEIDSKVEFIAPGIREEAKNTGKDSTAKTKEPEIREEVKFIEINSEISPIISETVKTENKENQSCEGLLNPGKPLAEDQVYQTKFETESVYSQEETENFKENLDFEYETKCDISKSSYNVRCKLYQTFLKIEVYSDLEAYTVYLKKLVVEGYPEDCSLKMLLNQYVFPRLYFKEKGNGKVLTFGKTFLIDPPAAKDLLQSFQKELEGNQYEIKIYRKRNYYLISAKFSDVRKRIWMPFKETKNFKEDTLVCRYFSNSLSLIQHTTLAIFEAKEGSSYSVYNQLISNEEFSIIIKKDKEGCLIEAFRPVRKTTYSLFLIGSHYLNFSVLEISGSLKIIKVREDFSLISELVFE